MSTRGTGIADLPADLTIRDALLIATTSLDKAGVEDSAVDARHLLAHALGVDRAHLLRAPEHQLDEAARNRLADFIARRVAREPVSRIIGERAFYGLDLALGAETLDPRPDTETLVNAAIALAVKITVRERPLRILDLGTGTGAIALALLTAIPNAIVTATDISTSALETARRNAERHGVADRITFVRTGWLEEITGRYHLVVSNPPYILTHEIAVLAPEVANWDPRAALDGGADGLDAYRAILSGTTRVLEPDGFAVVEVGHDQAAAVASLASNHGLVPAPLTWPLLRDLGGNTRCVALATSGRNWKISLGIAGQES